MRNYKKNCFGSDIEGRVFLCKTKDVQFLTYVEGTRFYSKKHKKIKNRKKMYAFNKPVFLLFCSITKGLDQPNKKKHMNVRLFV